MKKTALTLTTILTASLLAAGCGDPVDPCQVNPTYQAADGSWREADHEPLDEDPCDAGDLEKKGHKVKKKSTKKR